MLETESLTIRFGGHVAVNDVSCRYAPGTLTAIVGPNGAGKTTYFNLISGQLRASAGSVRLNGRDLTPLSAPARMHAGLGRAFQLTQLFPRLSARRDHAAADLPHGDQRKLEIAMLIALEPQVFMFDEPTAGMSVDDVPVVLELIREIKNDPSKTILLVEHKMDVVRELADRIVVLHNGQLMADGDPATVIASPIVQQAYLGMSPTEPKA
ncbi:ABC transporter ATP-binding protein [Achromobacter sp. Bel]|uniref:ABC transporter ATP-binding protein n=1 Tax=Achromobacter sp. Bel TaxID=2727415 RepID=UPI00145F21A2|nr:ABC transporter ATP-binding protein [Achromobacter sp. Bel]NMK45731.1 ABC transporter ATP-binding protein [Achromobacter sp. Bel]